MLARVKHAQQLPTHRPKAIKTAYDCQTL